MVCVNIRARIFKMFLKVKKILSGVTYFFIPLSLIVRKIGANCAQLLIYNFQLQMTKIFLFVKNRHSNIKLPSKNNFIKFMVYFY